MSNNITFGQLQRGTLTPPYQYNITTKSIYYMNYQRNPEIKESLVKQGCKINLYNHIKLQNPKKSFIQYNGIKKDWPQKQKYRPYITTTKNNFKLIKI